jgi:hypothetical protein
MAIIQKSLTIDVDDVTSVIVTTIEQETGGDGLFVREVRVFGTPENEATSPPQEFVLRIRSVERASIQILTPPFEL